MRKAKIGDKVMTLREAIKKFVNDGDTIYTGMAGRSFGAVYEIIRQRKRDLTIMCGGGTEEISMLVGAGCVRRLINSYRGLETWGLSHAIRRAIEHGVPRPIEIEEYSNFSITAGFVAAATGVPFMPVKSLLGSDIVKISTFMGNNKLRVIECPFTGEKVVVVPAMSPDVAIVHAQRADRYGNVQMWGFLGDDLWAVRAAKKVIITVEEVVDEEVIRRDPNRTVFPSFIVDAVVELPFGQHPWHKEGYYDMDLEFREMYVKMEEREETLQKFFDEWVYGVEDHMGYLKKLGFERLWRLRAKHVYCYPVNYGY
jgi:glutaconate CoA-transferase subunit A